MNMARFHQQTNTASDKCLRNRREEDSKEHVKKDVDASLIEDSSLFNILFSSSQIEISPTHEAKYEAPPETSSSRPGALPPYLDENRVLDALEVHITEELDGNPSAMKCVLLLPHLGEVHMNSKQSLDQWHIHLAFVNPAAMEYARRTQSTITHRLREKLNSSIVLGLSLRAPSQRKPQ